MANMLALFLLLRLSQIPSYCKLYLLRIFSISALHCCLYLVLPFACLWIVSHCLFPNCLLIFWFCRESSLEHILPDNLFASPTKSAGDHGSIFSTGLPDADDNSSVITTTTTSSNTIPMLPSTSTLTMASLKSCYFQMPRYFAGPFSFYMP